MSEVGTDDETINIDESPKGDSQISFLAEDIVNACREKMGSFVGGIVVGGPRKGKTAYTIKVMRDVYRTLHPEIDMKTAYMMAIDSLFLKIDRFLKQTSEKQHYMKSRLPDIDWSQRIPVGTLDDASIYAGPDLYFQDQDLYSAFQGTMTTIGTAYSSILITAPSPDALTKCLREYYDYYIIKITETSSDDSLATIQEWYRKPGTASTRVLRKVAEDVFTRHIPKKIYAKYLGPRIEMGIEAVDYLMARSEMKNRPLTQTNIPKTPVITDPALKELIENVIANRMVKKKRKSWTTLPAAPTPLPSELVLKQTNTSKTDAP